MSAVTSADGNGETFLLPVFEAPGKILVELGPAVGPCGVMGYLTLH